MGITVGDRAPDFTLKSKSGDDLKDISLRDYEGQKNVVILFFPLAYTGVCTDEMCSVSGGLADYDALDAQVLGISVDSPFAQDAWAKETASPFPCSAISTKRSARLMGRNSRSCSGFAAWQSGRLLSSTKPASCVLHPWLTTRLCCRILTRSKRV